jgi:hypothetical protein
MRLRDVPRGRIVIHESAGCRIRRRAAVEREREMRKFLLLLATCLLTASWDAKAQTDLSAYADANGFLDVQRLTCAQLAGTWQGDADMLMAWYSGWYNGLAKKHFFHTSRAKRLEHEVILHCQANPGIRIIDAIAVIFKDERVRHGIHLKAD